MKTQLENIKQEALALLECAKTPAELDELRVRFLGKKGELTAVLKLMGKLSAEERPVMGQLANTVRAQIEEKLEILHMACQSGDDEQVRAALKRVVPTYKTPEEVNAKAEQAEEMRNRKTPATMN